MAPKQKSTNTFRIQTPSIPELQQGLTLARMRFNLTGLRHRGRKLKDGPLLNAIVAWFLSQSEEKQAAIAQEGLRRFEQLLEGESDRPAAAEESSSATSESDIPAEGRRPKGLRVPAIRKVRRQPKRPDQSKATRDGE